MERAPLFSTAAKVLVGMAPRKDLLRLDERHLALGLICTWIVGMGRYWDDPNAVWMQKLGFGSVAYVFALALLLWGIVAPFKLKNWSYFTLLTYVTLTAPPAILYAIPIEWWTDLSTARDINVWFLAAVAAWRLALYFVFLFRVTELRWYVVVVVGLVPIVAIVTALVAMNVHRVVFNIMGGLRDDGNPHEGEYFFLMGITFLSWMSLLVLGPAWCGLAWMSASPKQRARVVRDYSQ